MKKSILIYLNRLRGQLWFRPFFFCLVSIAAALVAQEADETNLNNFVPVITTESIENLLNTISSSMLVIAIFAVGSMISAFSAASSTATPRSFKIVVTDDVSQNALSAFIGAFIFSIVATVALKNGYYGEAGRFVLFLFTLFLFSVVILTFLRWVDRISRLGRLEHTISQVETVAAESMAEYIQHPLLEGVPLTSQDTPSVPVFGRSIGYIQHVNMETLQELAEEQDIRILLNARPGTFVQPNLPIAYLSGKQQTDLDEMTKEVNEAFTIGQTRVFDDDPRFGLIALTEIASRALSPGINDPGTAIQIIGSHVRLFFLWKASTEKEEREVRYDRIEVPDLSVQDLFEDAFRPIARDGAGNIEVMLRLQKALCSIESINRPDIKKAALLQSKEAFLWSEQTMTFKANLELLRKECLFKSEAAS